MPFFLKLNHLTIIHAGISNKLYLNNAKLNLLTLLLYIRDLDENGKFLPLNHKNKNAKFWADIYNGHEGFIVYGHSPFINPNEKKNSIGIDTGCVYGNKLSAVIIPNTLKPWEYEIISVKAKRKYATPHLPLK